MASSLSSIVAKDGTPATIVGGILAVDKSGAGTGPFFQAQTLVDTQGVNTATIKAASTAVAAGDTSIAVGLHPTSPLPAGTNVIGHVIVDTAPSTAVTNAGTFATQATLAAETTKNIGAVRVTDGTNTATVKAVSTAPVTATDQALVVAMRPDSPGIIATGTQASPSASYLSTVAAGDVAAAATDSGNPVKIGGIAKSSEPTALTTGQRAQAYTDLVGKLIVLPYANPENFVSGAITTAMTGTTTTSLVAAPAAGLRNYITTIICSNSHATVGTDVIIQDGSGGTTLLTIPAAAVYGGAVITLPTPLRQPTTATAIFCANVTTGASTKVSAVGYKGA